MLHRPETMRARIPGMTLIGMKPQFAKLHFMKHQTWSHLENRMWHQGINCWHGFPPPCQQLLAGAPALLMNQSVFDRISRQAIMLNQSFLYRWQSLWRSQHKWACLLLRRLLCQRYLPPYFRPVFQSGCCHPAHL